MDASATTVIGGRYRLAGLLGVGGIGAVYTATHLPTGRQVALKVLQPCAEVAKRAQTRTLFEHEFMTLAQISHPRIVSAFDYGIDAEHGPFYAMELLDGGDLQQRAPVPFREACSFARDVCSALALLHTRRQLYRDLSPRNIRCTAQGDAKLIDFGALAPMGICREVLGTPPFVAPEVLKEQPLDARTDLYALGATLYFALTGTQAYPARALTQLWELWRTLPPAPSSYVADIPEAVDRLIMELLQLDPKDRPSSAIDVMQRLEAIAELPPDSTLLVHASHLAAPTLLGRGAALQRAADALSAACDGRGRGTMVTGAHGAGRTRFLEECALRAKLQGCVVVQLTASDADGAEYALLRAIGRALLHAAPDVATEAAQPLRHTLGDVVSELRSDGSHDLLALARTADQRHERIQDAFCAWFDAIAQRRPLCLVLDDAARADASTVALLGRLLRQHTASRCWLVWSVAREQRATADWSRAFAQLERACGVIQLEPLTSDESHELLLSIFGPVPNLTQLTDYLERTAAGNPRDALQLIQQLVRERIISYVAGAWSLPARLASAGLPANLMQALQQRVAKLEAPTRRVALAFAAEPRQHFTLAECSTLLDEREGSDVRAHLRECVDAGIVVSTGSGYRLAQLGFAAALASSVSPDELTAQHRRLARLFEARGDGVRAAQYLLLAGEIDAGLDLLIRTSAESERRTDASLQAYFAESRNLPVEWLALYQDALTLCETRGRPRAQQDALLSRVAGFLAIAHTARGVDGMTLLKTRLDRLAYEVGLDLYAALPSSLDLATRLQSALSQAKQRFDATPPASRTLAPSEAIRPLATTLLITLGMISFTNDVQAHRQLPSLGPLAALSPSLWVVQKTIDGLGARISGRFEQTVEIYRALLERMQQPDRAQLQEAEHRSTMLRVSLSAGTVEACMGLASAFERAALVGAAPEYETQGLMLRYLCELWQGHVSEARRAKQAIERRQAFSSTHNNYDGQFVLAELGASVLLEDLTGLREAVESAKRVAAQYPTWLPVAAYCQGEYERVRGDARAALACVERALATMSAPSEHQIWVNVAAAHVRILADLGQDDEALRLGRHYLKLADEHQLGYAAGYIRLSLSRVCRRSDAAAACELAEQTLRDFQALGSTGLNLAVAFESRALAELATGASEGFEQYAALCSAACEPVGRRLRQERRRALLRQERRDDGPMPTSAFASELSAVMESGLDMEQRSIRALAILSHHTEAQGGVLFTREGASVRRVASFGDVPHMAQLESWARAYFEGQLLAQDASTSQLDAARDVVGSAHGVPEGMYFPKLLGHDTPEGYVYAGLLVLVMPVSSDLGWMTVFADTLGRALLPSGAHPRRLGAGT